jgi:nuclear pore complex protein Nup88
LLLSKISNLCRYFLALTPLVTDDDEGLLPPLLAIDRIELASGESTLRRPRSAAAAAANELAPFVSVQWDPGCRERVFCCAGGAVHGITLTWLAAVEGAVDEEEEGGGGGSGSGGAGELSLPTVVTLLDSPEVLLGVAPVGDPLAEGLLVAVDAGGVAHGLHPSPPLPGGLDDDDNGGGGAKNAAAAAAATAAAAAAAEASAELQALVGGPGGAPPAPPAGAAALRPGTVEGNTALAAAAAGLKERHLRYAHRVHAATRRHSLRLAGLLHTTTSHSRSFVQSRNTVRFNR